MKLPGEPDDQALDFLGLNSASSKLKQRQKRSALKGLQMWLFYFPCSTRLPGVSS